MNPLQKYPHLFANGEFQFKDEYNNVQKLESVYNDRLLHTEPPYGFQYHFANQCTLIARPIENMTDDEHKEYSEYHQKYLIRNWKSLPWWQVMNLLSIGVYPFDQKAFDDGIVIDITTL